MKPNQRQEFTEAMEKVIGTAQKAAQIERFYKVVGGTVGMAARIFGLPWLAMYAWNGMTTLPDWPYWPTVAAGVVISIVLTTLRGPGK